MAVRVQVPLRVLGEALVSQSYESFFRILLFHHLFLFQKYGNKFGLYSKNMAINLENEGKSLTLRVKPKIIS